MKTVKIVLCSFFTGALSIQVSSQIVFNNITADEAVEILVGEGVSYSNVTFTGDPLQLGYFTGGEGTDFEIPSGVMLCADDVEYNELGGIGTFLNAPVSGNPDLLDIANSVPPLINQTFSVSSVNDVAILEFDFIPNGDSLIFNYVFGSDEYLEWVNSTYNDVFAFFLAGPGLAGPYDAPAGFPDGSINIAFIPDTDPNIPITISSVNNTLNDEYYINNPNFEAIQLDGFTVSLQAYAPVECGQTYHIKLAIADGSDASLKSSVAFEEGSFSSTGNVSVNINNPPTPNWPNNTLAEDCVFGSFVVGTQGLDYLVLDLGGSAENGVDYELGIEMVGDTIFIGELDSVTFTVPVNPLEDNIIEGTEHILLSFVFTNPCGELDTATAEIFLLDQPALSITPIQDIVLCGPAQATAIPVGGFEPFVFLWSDSSPDPTINITELGEYEVTITDFCGQSATEAFEVVPPEGVIVEVEESLFVCLDGTVTANASVSQGASPYAYTWTGSNSSQPTALFGAEDVGYQYVTVIDDCGQQGMDSVMITIPTQLTGVEDLDLCVNVGTGELAEGGTPPYAYTYDTDAFNTDDVDVLVPDQAGVYTIEVTDACGQEVNIPVIVSVCDTQIPNVFTPNGDGKNDAFEIFGGEDFPKSTMLIYNRWGNLIYESNSYVNGWTANESSDGVYFYIYKRSDGKSYEGHVQVLRD